MSAKLLSPPAFHAERPTRALLTLAAPMIGMTLSRMLMGFIDFAMVSQLGTAAQAAISPCTMLLFTIACVGMGMAQGVQTFVSQADGRNEPERGGAYLGQTMYLALLAFLVSAPVAFWTPVWFPWVAALGEHSPEMQANEIQFLRYGLWSIGPMAAVAGLESFFNGIKRPRVVLAGVLVSLGVITVVNYVLIFGHFGFPAMGIAGSGIATLLAWLARIAVLLNGLRDSEIDRRYAIWRGLRLDLAKLLGLVRVGGPIAMQWLVDIGAWFVFLEFMMPPFGTLASAGATLAIQFMHLSFMPAMGIGLALTTQVGNAVGAGRPEEAAFRVRIARRLVLGYMTVMGAIFVMGGAPLASLFASAEDPVENQAVIAMAAKMLIWVALFQMSDALCIVYSFAARGVGDTRVPAMLFAVCCWGIFVSGGFTMTHVAPGWGVHGPWMMCTLYIVVLGGLLYWRFHSEAWRSIRLFDQKSAEPAPEHEPVAEPVAAP